MKNAITDLVHFNVFHILLYTMQIYFLINFFHKEPHLLSVQYLIIIIGFIVSTGFKYIYLRLWGLESNQVMSYILKLSAMPWGHIHKSNMVQCNILKWNPSFNMLKTKYATNYRLKESYWFHLQV